MCAWKVGFWGFLAVELLSILKLCDIASHGGLSWDAAIYCGFKQSVYWFCNKIDKITVNYCDFVKAIKCSSKNYGSSR